MAATIAKRRTSKSQLPESHESIIYVDPASFRELAVSNRHMVRMDQAVPNHRGLRDLDSGEIFVVEERRLHDTKR